MAKPPRRTLAPKSCAQIIPFPIERMHRASCSRTQPAVIENCTDLDVLETMVRAYFNALEFQVAQIRNHSEA